MKFKTFLVIFIFAFFSVLFGNALAQSSGCTSLKNTSLMASGAPPKTGNVSGTIAAIEITNVSGSGNSYQIEGNFVLSNPSSKVQITNGICNEQNNEIIALAFASPNFCVNVFQGGQPLSKPFKGFINPVVNGNCTNTPDAPTITLQTPITLRTPS